MKCYNNNIVNIYNNVKENQRINTTCNKFTKSTI